MVGTDNIHNLDKNPCNNWMKLRTCCPRGSESTPDTPLKFQRSVDEVLLKVMKNVLTKYHHISETINKQKV